MRKLLFAVSILAAVAASNQALAQSESEPNGNISFANMANAFPTTITGSLSTASGADLNDFFRFAAVAGTFYQFNATPLNTSFISPLDIGLEILNSSGSSVVIRDVNGDNVGEVLNWTAPSTGNFYLVVYEATATSNAIASYSVIALSFSSVNDWELY